MRRLTHAVCLLIASTFASGVELRPLANGDSIAGVAFYVSQQDGALTYSKNSEATYKLSIDANGNRHYMDHHGSTYWIYDRHFTRVLFQGRDLPPEQFLAFLPLDGKVEPEMRWDVPVHQTR